MKILGIETSCDETAAAVVENGTRVLANVIASQIKLHRRTGGVVPEVAAREHVLKIIPVIDEALKQAGKTLQRTGETLKKTGRAKTNHFSLQDIDAIAVTKGPGLLSSLIIGVSAASALAMASGKPLIPVNHIAGHIYANWLGETRADLIKFPLVVLTVSGGHNELVLMRDHVHFKLLGETLDDAAGEAFDKVARLLGLAYPGGPQISKVALSGNGGQPGDPQKYKFPKAYLHEESYDFSFSGLKTAVLNMVKEEFAHHKKLSKKFIADCAASFQEAVCGVLTDKLLRAANQYQVKEVHLAGGVSANRRLRTMVAEQIKAGYYHNQKGHKIPLTHQPLLRFAENISYCTDNAAMIASTAYFHYQKAPKSYIKMGSILADPNLSLYK